MSSEDLVTHLVGLEGSPWPEWRDGKPITKMGVARLLKRFEIRPQQTRFGDDTRKGYKLSDFDDPLARYLSPSEPKQSKQPAPDADETASSQAKREELVSDARKASDQHEQRSVSVVSDDSPPESITDAAALVDYAVGGVP